MRTSYFNRRPRPKEPSGLISIAFGTPIWFKGARYPALAPTASRLRAIQGAVRDHRAQQDYAREFKLETLRPLNAKKTWEELCALVAPFEPVLLCHERAGEFCHRRLVAEWFGSEMLQEVLELAYQPSLPF